MTEATTNDFPFLVSRGKGKDGSSSWIHILSLFQDWKITYVFWFLFVAYFQL